MEIQCIYPIYYILAYTRLNLCTTCTASSTQRGGDKSNEQSVSESSEDELFRRSFSRIACRQQRSR